MAPVLKLVLLWAHAKHGLGVGVELIVKVVQESRPGPVLESNSVYRCADSNSRGVSSLLCSRCLL